MTDFKTFLESAESAALRQAEVARARAEASGREQSASQYTSKSKERAQLRQKAAGDRLANQKEKAKADRERQLQARRASKERIARTAHNVRVAAKGVAKAGKSVVGYAKQKITKK